MHHKSTLKKIGTKKKLPKPELSKYQLIDNYFNVDKSKSFSPKTKITLPVPVDLTSSSNSKPLKKTSEKKKKAIAKTSKDASIDTFINPQKEDKKNPITQPTSSKLHNRKEVSKRIQSGTSKRSTDDFFAELEQTDIKRARVTHLELSPKVDDGESMAAELERLANEKIGKLGKYPSDDEDDDVGASSQQDSIQQIGGRKNALFMSRIEEMMKFTEVAKSDILNIRPEFVGFNNLCRSTKVCVLSRKELPLEALTRLKCTRFEFIFLLAPTHCLRLSLLQAFYAQYGGINATANAGTSKREKDTQCTTRRFRIKASQVTSILRHITQTYERVKIEDNDTSKRNSSIRDINNSKHDNNSRDSINSKRDSKNSHSNDSSRKILDESGEDDSSNNSSAELISHFFSSESDYLSRIAIKAARYCAKVIVSGQEECESDNVNWCQARIELCLENIRLFFSILPLVKMEEWKVREICALLIQIAFVYMDAIVVEIRSKICSAIELLIDTLSAEKAQKVIKKFLHKLAKLSVDFRALFLLVSGMIPLRFFSSHALRFDFLNKFFAQIVTENVPSLSDVVEKKPDTLTSQLAAPFREATPGIINIFQTFNDVTRKLIERPTDIYIVMQMLDLCVTDVIINKENTETLNIIRESLHDAVIYMKKAGRMDELVLRNMSDVSHRINMVVRRRHANAHISSLACYNPYTSSSSDDGVERASTILMT